MVWVYDENIESRLAMVGNAIYISTRNVKEKFKIADGKWIIKDYM